ncbi:lysyl-tRNA synthetase, class 2 [Desulfurobacterium pacificum]|uniref:Lysyl-tRNA synthetase, class 2 n=1 Tax=Desulfurobacterium pacificum TaxID=240166 RepID=A0ABY1NGL2_9BACT|nr:amino acid--tRNA ligase-related protein [Desulfurobacterium pacificum]SMP08814.1 lysyl-tRNA synthetase, class 2 [Desulfurobacterium pacificum]
MGLYRERDVSLLELLRLRKEARERVRGFFEGRGFLEVDTPIMVPYENPDDNVENVRAVFRDFLGKRYEWFLHTSPEFFMKRIVWEMREGGIYQIVRVFRDGEITDLHSIEFTMIEWYRVGGDYRDGMKETFGLVREVVGDFANVKGRKITLNGYEIFTVEEAFREFAGVNVFDREEVKKVACEEDYESGFFKLLVERVEPALGKIDKPVFLIDYPEEFSAMARVKNGVAERFELYVGGVEIANGYTELRDYESYLRKFEEKGKKAVDGGFLSLLKKRLLPECEGVALGFDRLLMLRLGAESIHDVIPYSTKRLLEETISNL